MTQYIEAIGRRKESSARVRLTPGSGTFTINEKPLDVYFPRMGDASAILAAVEAAGQNASLMDVTVTVQGGGISGQRDAVQLGLARVLVSMDEGARHALREKGMQTRDARIKERKKPCLKRARKAPTYTKR